MRVQLVNTMGLDEAGVDGGGVFREFLSELLKTAFDPNRGFFRLTKDNLLYPNPHVHLLHQNFLNHYYFIGRMLGKALYENLLVELPLAEFFMSKVIGRHSDVDMHHLASLIPSCIGTCCTSRTTREMSLNWAWISLLSMTNWVKLRWVNWSQGRFQSNELYRLQGLLGVRMSYLFATSAVKTAPQTKLCSEGEDRRPNSDTGSGTAGAKECSRSLQQTPETIDMEVAELDPPFCIQQRRCGGLIAYPLPQRV
ncbi:uncharacterized protein LOC124375122 [Homalodisca vitripennis]|uniref:uncharacterized protein LOC124375122 n=1 Tax=Homalodisca vitripennis TaxID=197043 RepID=UPI001EECDA8E|nr:uncharacterized protein LOC124375122 [Homalodisca vitripennis]